MFVKTHEIIDAFCEMDIERLDTLLDENKTYQEATKPVFLNKLQQAFRQISPEGKERLELRTGVCNAKDCHFGCRGFLFKSPTNGKNIAFIFEENGEEDDFSDIYTCHDFKTSIDVIDRSQSLFLKIGNDEKAKFHASDSFMHKKELCNTAIAEITNGNCEEFVVSKDGILEWLEKKKKVRLSFDLPPIFYETFITFYSLYNSISDAGKYLNLESQATLALTEINLNQPNEVEKLVAWLLKHKELGN
jgi:hypothetical protein